MFILTLGSNIFDAPEGKYRGVLERAEEPKKRINKPCQRQVRLTFRIFTPDDREYLVARTFCAELGYGTELYSFLESMLDGDFGPILNDNGDVDLDLLIGKPADLVITHYGDGKHSKPFARIAGIFPAGKLTN